MSYDIIAANNLSYTKKTFSDKKKVLGENEYNKYTKTVEEVIADNKNKNSIEYLSSMEAPKNPFNQTMETISTMNKNGIALVFDTEVIGSLEHSEQFAVTELSVKALNLETKELTDVGNINFGLPELGKNSQSTSIISDMKKLLNFQDVEPEKVPGLKVTMGRAGYILGKESGEVIEKDDYTKAIRKLADDKTMPVYGEASGATALEELSSKIKEYTDNGATWVSYNGDKSDIPWVKQALIQNGLDENLIDFSNHLDMYTVVKGIDEKEYRDILKNAGLENAKGSKTLGVTTKLVGHSLDNAHVATDDVIGLSDTIHKPVLGVDGESTGKTIIDHFIGSTKNKTEELGFKELEKGEHLYAKTSLNNGSNFDVSVNAVTGKNNSYQQYATGRGLFYSVDDITFTEYDNLPKNLQKEFKNGMWQVNLTSMDEGQRKHSSIITRGSQEELLADLNLGFDKFQVVDELAGGEVGNVVTREFAYKQAEIVANDKARRKYESFFRVGERGGFDDAKQYYEAYNNLNSISNERIGRNLNVNEVSKLINEKSLTIDGKTLNVDETLGNLVYTKFDETINYLPERASDFIGMYETLGNTTETLTPIINKIDKGIVQDGTRFSNNARKTIALGNAYNILEENVEQLALIDGDKSLLNRTVEHISDIKDGVISMSEPTKSDLQVTNYLNVSIDGNQKNISMTSKNKLESSLYSAVDNVIKEKGFDGFSANNVRADYYLEVAKDLLDRGTLNNDMYLAASEASSYQEIANIISSGVMEKREAIMSKTSVENIARYAPVSRMKIDEINEGFNPTLGKAKRGYRAEVEAFGNLSIDEQNAIAEFNKLNPSPSYTLGNGSVKTMNGSSTYSSLDDYVKENNDRLYALATDSGLKKKPGNLVGMIGDTVTATPKLEFNYNNVKFDKKDYKGFIKHKEQFVKDNFEFFSENLGYNERQIGYVHDALFNSTYGLNSRGYSSVLTSSIDNHGKLQYNLVSFNPEDSANVLQSLSEGVAPTKILEKRLPKIESSLNGNLKYVSVGTKRSSVVDYITESIPDKNKIGLVGGVKLEIDDTVGKSLRSDRLVHQSVDRLVEDGDWTKANRRTKRAATNVVFEELGTSSLVTVLDKAGKRKGNVENISDLNRYVKVDALSALLPQLYESNEKVRTSIDNTFGREKALDIFSSYKHRVVNSSNYHRSASELGLDMSEYFIKNLVNGDRLIDEMANMEGLDEKGFATTKEIIEKIKNGNYTTQGKASLYKDGFYLVEGNIEQGTPMSHMGTPRREQISQTLNTINMRESELKVIAQKHGIENIYDHLEKSGIYANEVIRTNYVNDKFLDVTAKEGDRIITGAYVNYKQMSSIAIQDKLDSLDLEDIARELRENGKEANIEDIEDVINHYRHMAGTYEQKSILSPELQTFMLDKRELAREKVDNIDDFKVGGRVSKDDKIVLGYLDRDGEKVPRYYKKGDGVISHINKEDGTIHIDMDSHPFDGSKVFGSGIEKSIGESVRVSATTGKDVSDISSVVYKRIAGEGVSQIAKFETGKHESGQIIYGTYINSLGVDVNSYGSNKDVEVFEERMNRHLKNWNFKKHEDKAYGIEGRYFFTMDNPYEMEQADKAIEAIMQEYKVDAENGDEFAQKFLKRMKHKEDNNILTVFMQKGMNSEVHRSSNGIDDVADGAKFSYRESAAIGSQFDSKYRKVVDGKSVRVAQPVIDLKTAAITSSKEYKEAANDIKNIIYTVGKMGEEEATGARPLLDNARVVKVDFEDLTLPSKNEFTVSELNKTLFAQYKDTADVLEINTGNVGIVNPVTGNTQNKIFVPVARTHIIDDSNIFIGKTNQKTAAVLGNIQELKNFMNPSKGAALESYDEILNRANKNYMDLAASMVFETNNKNGLVNSAMLSGRLPFSMSGINFGIIEPSFRDAEKTELAHPLNNQIVKMVDGKPVYQDVAFISNKKMREFGLKDSTIVKQVLEEGQGGDEFVDLLIRDGLLTTDKNLNVMSKDEFEKVVRPDLDKKFSKIEKEIVGDFNIDRALTFEEFKASDLTSDYEIKTSSRLNNLNNEVKHLKIDKQSKMQSDFNSYKKYQDMISAIKKDEAITYSNAMNEFDGDLNNGKMLSFEEFSKRQGFEDRKVKLPTVQERNDEIVRLQVGLANLEKQELKAGVDKTSEKKLLIDRKNEIEETLRNDSKRIKANREVNREARKAYGEYEEAYRVNSAEIDAKKEEIVKSYVDKVEELKPISFEEYKQLNGINYDDFDRSIANKNAEILNIEDSLSSSNREIKERSEKAYADYLDSYVPQRTELKREIEKARESFEYENGYDSIIRKKQKEVADSFYENVGILATDTRNPVKDSGASHFVRVKTSPYLSDSATIQTPWAAVRHHGDVDGDTKFTHLFGLTKDDSGNVKLRALDDAAVVAGEEMLELQAQDNAKIVDKLTKGSIKHNGKFYNKTELIDMPLEEMNSILKGSGASQETIDEVTSARGKFATNIVDYRSAIDEMYKADGGLSHTNYYAEDRFFTLGTKARHNKATAIGQASNNNTYLKNLLDSVIEKNPQDIEKFTGILESLDESEQKLIDVKHLLRDEISPAAKYNESIRKMIGSSKDTEYNKAFKNYFEAVKQMGVYGELDESLKVEDIISNNFDKNATGASDLRVMYDLLKDEENKKILADPYTKGQGKVYRKGGEALDVEAVNQILDTSLSNGDIEHLSIKGKNSTEVLRDALEQTTVSNGDILVTRNNNLAFEVLEANLHGSDKSIIMKNLVTNDIHKIGDTELGVSFKSFLDDNYEMIKGENAATAKAKVLGQAENFQTIIHMENAISGGAGSNDIIMDSMLMQADDSKIQKGRRPKGRPDGITQRESLFNKLAKEKYVDMSYGEYMEGLNNRINSTSYKNAVDAIAQGNTLDELKSMHVANNVVRNSGLESSDKKTLANEFYEDIKSRGAAAGKNRAKKAKEFNARVNQIASDNLSRNEFAQEKLLGLGDARVHNIEGIKNSYDTEKFEFLKNNPNVDRKVLDSTYEEAFSKSVADKLVYNDDVILKTTKAYSDIYKNNKGFNSAGLNWGASIDDVINSSTDDTLSSFSKSKIGFGKFANLSIGDLSKTDMDYVLRETLSMEMLEALGDDRENVLKMIEESKDRIRGYLRIANSSSRSRGDVGQKYLSEILNRETNASKAYKANDLIATEEINESIMERGRIAEAARIDKNKQNVHSTVNKLDDIMEDSGKFKKLLKNKYVAGFSAIAVGGLALASSMASKKYLEPGKVSSEGDNFKARRESQENRDSMQFEAPPSREKRSILEGISMRVRGKGSTPKEDIYRGIGAGVTNATGREVNINTNEESSSRNISKKELEREVARLIR